MGMWSVLGNEMGVRRHGLGTGLAPEGPISFVPSSIRTRADHAAQACQEGHPFMYMFAGSWQAFPGSVVEVPRARSSPAAFTSLGRDRFRQPIRDWVRASSKARLIALTAYAPPRATDRRDGTRIGARPDRCGARCYAP